MATRSAAVRLPTVPRFERLAVGGSWLALLALTAGFLLADAAGRTPSLETQLLVYFVGMVALNLPHGGYEHFSNLRRRGVPFGTRYVASYLCCIAAFVALFFAAALAALALAFAVAAAKAGHGDLRAMDALVGSDHLEHRFQRGLAAFVRGGAVMIVPLVVWPMPFYGFSSFMVRIFDPAAAGPLGGYLDAARTVFGAAFALAVVAHLAGGYLVGGLSRSWLLDVAETSLLVGYFATVPIVVAIGLYFPLWYSLRQAGRERYVSRTAPRDGGLSVARTIAAMVVGGAATAALAVALWIVAPNPLGDASLLPGLVAFYTVFVCIIALPHVLIGEWLDGDRGIWYVP